MNIEEDKDLSLFNSYRIKSKCKRAFFPSSENDFIKIFRNYTEEKIILGGGYNIILSQPYYNCNFILIGESFSNIEFKDDVVEVESGANLKDISELALVKKLSGFEIFYDIPSSMGGAVVMNAGASGEDIGSLLLKVRYIDLNDLTIKEISRDEIGFEYRNSFFQRNKNNVILKVWLKLNPGNYENIENKMLSVKEARWAKQPKNFPNAGSVFKRPKGHYVGTMIQELGLKGLSIGGAQISEKHAGFIINKNNASGKDILELIKLIQNKVKEAYNVDLEVEQRII